MDNRGGRNALNVTLPPPYMLGILLLLFIALPLVDLYILIQLAGVIGLVETLLLVVFTGVVGASFIRREGTSVLLRLQQAVMAEEAGQAVVEGALITAGGILLISPGVVTDLIGFLFVLPWTRPRIAAWLRQRLQDSAAVTVEIGTGQPPI
ncbi:MAG: FxsA family protein [Candidatus Nanohaloarchaea archaeon]